MRKLARAIKGTGKSYRKNINTQISNMESKVHNAAKSIASRTKQLKNSYMGAMTPTPGMKTMGHNLKNEVMDGDMGLGEAVASGTRLARNYMNAGSLGQKAMRYGTVAGGLMALEGISSPGQDVGLDSIIGIPFI